MSKLFLSAFLIISIALFSPLIFLPKGDDAADTSPQETPEVLPIAEKDAEYSFTALIDGEVVSVTMADYLVGAVAAEMPALFELEALKAQAVAIRTYIMNKASYENPNHPEADVCTDPSCCKAYISEQTMSENWGEDYETYINKIRTATAETDGQYLTYEGQAIQAVFHAGSIGETENSSAIWSDVPYLASVDSPETEETVPALVTKVSFNSAEFMQALCLAYPAISLPESPEQWISEINYTDTGRVDSLVIAEVSISGNSARSIFSLRSTDFDLEYKDEEFVFTVRGYGHGVGMSQEGANLYAKDGMSYSEILAHYYIGAELVG